MSKKTLFDHLNDLTINKIDFDSSNDEQVKSYSQYMINRFVSMTDIYLPIVNEINQYDLPKETHYNYYKNLLPKRKHYFKYIKKKKDINLEDKKLLCIYFECGLKEIENFINVLTEEQIEEILKIYRTVN